MTDATQVTATRLSEQERSAIERIARSNDRTPSREVRRAVRFYLAHVQEAERFLREAAGGAR